jgi:cyclophilin family peptidyl-prolyl cis-trans isomerase
MRLIIQHRLSVSALALAAFVVVGAAASSAGVATQTQPSVDRRAPDRFDVRLDTTKGLIVIDVHRDWAPRGADRFYTLVEARYFDDSRFFRVVADRWAQFGIAGNPAVARVWRERAIPDDPRIESNTKGAVAFAFAVPNGRTTQVFVNLRDNSETLDKEPFAPFGRVSRGMDVVDALNSEYGETCGGGIRAGKQAPLFERGNAFLDEACPRLDRIYRVSVHVN